MAFSFPEPRSKASDWDRQFDLDGQEIWVHKTTGGSVKGMGRGWHYRLSTGEWSDVMPNLGIAMDRAMGSELDGVEIIL
jgi:hypothetical protein